MQSRLWPNHTSSLVAFHTCKIGQWLHDIHLGFLLIRTCSQAMGEPIRGMMLWYSAYVVSSRWRLGRYRVWMILCTIQTINLDLFMQKNKSTILMLYSDFEHFHVSIGISPYLNIERPSHQGEGIFCHPSYSNILHPSQVIRTVVSYRRKATSNSFCIAC